MKQTRPVSGRDRLCADARQILLAAWVSVLCVFVPFEVMAACDASGLFSGNIGVAGKCDGGTGVFSSLLCFFEQALAQTLAVTYCGFQANFQGPLTALIATAVCIFGFAVVTGVVKMLFRDGIIALLKLAAVFVFATNSDFGIKMAGRFFMGMLQEGSAMALAPMGGNTSLSQPDSFITGFFNFMSDPNVADLSVTNSCGAGSCLNDTILTIISNCIVSLTVLGMALIVFMPIILAFMIMLLANYFMLYIKAMFAYLTGIVIITFLLMLSPLFFSFFLFRLTFPLFEKWWKFMLAFSIQSMILFSFLALLGLVAQSFTLFIYGLLRLLRPYDVTLSALMYILPVSNVCSICEYRIDTDANGIKTVQCQPAIQGGMGSTDPQSFVTPAAFPWDKINPTPDDSGGPQVPPIPTMPLGLNGLPITYTLGAGSVISSKVNVMPGDPLQDTGKNYVIPLENLIKRTDFLLYMAANILAFLIIAKVMQEFIQKAPDLAQALSGAPMAGGMGRGGAIPSLARLEVGLKGFEKNLMRNPLNATDGNIVNRLREAVMGRKDVNRSEFTTDAGYKAALASAPLKGGFFNAMINGEEPDNDETKRREARLKEEQKQVDLAAKEVQVAQAAKTKSEEELRLLDAQKKKLATDRAADPQEMLKLELAFGKANSALKASHETLKQKQDMLEQRKASLREASSLLKPNTSFDNKVAGIAAAAGTVLVGGAIAGDMLARQRKGAQTAGDKRKEGKDKATEGRPAMGTSRENAAYTGASPGNFRFSGPDYVQLSHAQEFAGTRMKSLDRKMEIYGNSLEGDQRDEYIARIEKAKKSLGQAKSSEEVQKVIAGLKDVDETFERFSDRGMMGSTAKAGVLSLTDIAHAADNLTTSEHGKDMFKAMAQLKADFGKAETEEEYQAVVNRIKEMPGKFLVAATNSLEGQLQTASRIVPDKKLEGPDKKVQAVLAQGAGTRDPGEIAKLLKSLEGTPEQIAMLTADGLMEQADLVRVGLPPSALEKFDANMKLAKEQMTKLKMSADDYDRKMKEMLAERKILEKAVADGLEKRVEGMSDRLSPEFQEAAYKTIKTSAADLRSAESGEEREKILGNLGELGVALDRIMRGLGFGRMSDLEGMLPAGIKPAHKMNQDDKDALKVLVARAQQDIKQQEEDQAKLGAKPAAKSTGFFSGAAASAKPATLVGSSSIDFSRGPGGLWEDVKKRATKMVPSFEGRKIQNSAGIDMEHGVQGFVDDAKKKGEQLWDGTKKRAQSIVPSFAGRKIQNSAGIDMEHGVQGFMDDAKKKAEQLWKDTKKRAQAIVPNFEGRKIQNSAGIDMEHGVQGFIDDAGKKGKQLWEDVKKRAKALVPNISVTSVSMPDFSKWKPDLSKLPTFQAGATPPRENNAEAGYDLTTGQVVQPGAAKPPAVKPEAAPAVAAPVPSATPEAPAVSVPAPAPTTKPKKDADLIEAIKIDVKTEVHVLSKEQHEKNEKRFKEIEERYKAAKTEEERQAALQQAIAFSKEQSAQFTAALSEKNRREEEARKGASGAEGGADTTSTRAAASEPVTRASAADSATGAAGTPTTGAGQPQKPKTEFGKADLAAFQAASAEEQKAIREGRKYDPAVGAAAGAQTAAAITAGAAGKPLVELQKKASDSAGSPAASAAPAAAPEGGFMKVGYKVPGAGATIPKPGRGGDPFANMDAEMEDGIEQHKKYRAAYEADVVKKVQAANPKLSPEEAEQKAIAIMTAAGSNVETLGKKKEGETGVAAPAAASPVAAAGGQTQAQMSRQEEDRRHSEISEREQKAMDEFRSLSQDQQSEVQRLMQANPGMSLEDAIAAALAGAGNAGGGDAKVKSKMPPVGGLLPVQGAMPASDPKQRGLGTGQREPVDTASMIPGANRSEGFKPVPASGVGNKDPFAALDDGNAEYDRMRGEYEESVVRRVMTANSKLTREEAEQVAVGILTRAGSTVEHIGRKKKDETPVAAPAALPPVSGEATLGTGERGSVDTSAMFAGAPPLQRVETQGAGLRRPDAAGTDNTAAPVTAPASPVQANKPVIQAANQTFESGLAQHIRNNLPPGVAMPPMPGGPGNGVVITSVKPQTKPNDPSRPISPPGMPTAEALMAQGSKVASEMRDRIQGAAGALGAMSKPGGPLAPGTPAHEMMQRAQEEMQRRQQNPDPRRSGPNPGIMREAMRQGRIAAQERMDREAAAGSYPAHSPMPTFPPVHAMPSGSVPNAANMLGMISPQLGGRLAASAEGRVAAQQSAALGQTISTMTNPNSPQMQQHIAMQVNQPVIQAANQAFASGLAQHIQNNLPPGVPMPPIPGAPGKSGSVPSSSVSGTNRSEGFTPATTAGATGVVYGGASSGGGRVDSASMMGKDAPASDGPKARGLNAPAPTADTPVAKAGGASTPEDDRALAQHPDMKDERNSGPRGNTSPPRYNMMRRTEAQAEGTTVDPAQMLEDLKKQHGADSAEYKAIEARYNKLMTTIKQDAADHGTSITVRVKFREPDGSVSIGNAHAETTAVEAGKPVKHYVAFSGDVMRDALTSDEGLKAAIRIGGHENAHIYNGDTQKPTVTLAESRRQEVLADITGNAQLADFMYQRLAGSVAQYNAAHPDAKIPENYSGEDLKKVSAWVQSNSGKTHPELALRVTYMDRMANLTEAYNKANKVETAEDRQARDKWIKETLVQEIKDGKLPDALEYMRRKEKQAGQPPAAPDYQKPDLYTVPTSKPASTAPAPAAPAPAAETPASTAPAPAAPAPVTSTAPAPAVPAAEAPAVSDGPKARGLNAPAPAAESPAAASDEPVAKGAMNEVSGRKAPQSTPQEKETVLQLGLGHPYQVSANIRDGRLAPIGRDELQPAAASDPRLQGNNMPVYVTPGKAMPTPTPVTIAQDADGKPYAIVTEANHKVTPQYAQQHLVQTDQRVSGKSMSDEAFEKSVREDSSLSQEDKDKIISRYQQLKSYTEEQAKKNLGDKGAKVVVMYEGSAEAITTREGNNYVGYSASRLKETLKKEDGLDQLKAVAAHEVAHIRNGDTSPAGVAAAHNDPSGRIRRDNEQRADLSVATVTGSAATVQHGAAYFKDALVDTISDYNKNNPDKRVSAENYTADDLKRVAAWSATNNDTTHPDLLRRTAALEIQSSLMVGYEKMNPPPTDTAALAQYRAEQQKWIQGKIQEQIANGTLPDPASLKPVPTPSSPAPAAPAPAAPAPAAPAPAAETTAPAPAAMPAPTAEPDKK